MWIPGIRIKSFDIKSFDIITNVVSQQVNLILKILDIGILKNKSSGPFVQSIVSLTSSLRGQLVKCFTTL